jgi:hypothetical protein
VTFDSQLDIFVTLNLKEYIEGFYSGGNQMIAVADPVNATSLCDSINVELHQSVFPYTTAYSSKGSIDIFGSGSFVFPGTVKTNNYYVVTKHRNSLQTWSSQPVSFSTISKSYDFTDANSKAFGNNLSVLPDGNFAIISGDADQDGLIDFFDLEEMENKLISFQNGYDPFDLTGDGLIESSDYSLIENNIGKVVLRP